jgi:hypothetical protein
MLPIVKDISCCLDKHHDLNIGSSIVVPFQVWQQKNLLEMSILLEIICFKCQKFIEITQEGKIQKLVETQELLASNQLTIAKQVSNLICKS